MTQDGTRDNSGRPRKSYVVVGEKIRSKDYRLGLVDDRAVAERYVARLMAYEGTRPVMPADPAAITPGKANDLAIWRAAHPGGPIAADCTFFYVDDVLWLDAATLRVAQ